MSLNVELPGLLRTLRQTRGLTVSDVARRTGLARKTITRWESGEYKPRLTELDSLLERLQATEQERRQCLELLTVPRALQRIKAERTSGTSSFPGIHYGDLLRALRIRKGWTQERTAAMLKVAQSTVTRWEHDEIRPDRETLLHWGQTLGAERAEIDALGSAHRSPLPLAGSQATGKDPDSMSAYFERLRVTLLASDLFPLSDLYYIAFEQRYRHSGAKSDRGRTMLSAIILAQADFAFRENHLPQAAQRALHASRFLPPPSRGTYKFHLRADLYGIGAQFPVKKHAAQLAHWLKAPLDAEHRAWLISMISNSLMENREIDQAIALAQAACQLAGEEAGPVEYALRRMDLAGLYLRADQPHRVLETLLSTEALIAFDQIQAQLMLAEAYLNLGDRSAAYDRLTSAVAQNHQIQASHYDQRIAKLRAQF